MNFKSVTAGLLSALLMLSLDASAQSRVIDVRADQVQGKLNRTFNFTIGAGRANEGLRADWQQQLAEIKRDAGFQYIRMHGLLSDDMGVFRINAQGKEEVNFQYIDALFDYLLSIDVKPFVELGFMPSAMASGTKTIFWWRGNVTPPRDYDQWGRLIEALTRHWTERYGGAEVAKWYFEVWNEPNLNDFWAGTQADYFKLYDHAARAVKKVNPRYRVGGPATAGAAWIPEMIDHAAKNNVPLDFVSTHTYGVSQGFLDEFGTTGTVLAKDEGAISNDVARNRKEIGASAMPNLELHYTEWSSSYTPADPTHDSYGGFGLMNTQGIKKPAYFAYQFLNALGPTELVNKDPRSIATTDGKGNVQVLLWDYTHTLPEKINNQQYFIKDLPAKAKGDAKVNLAGLKQGSYQLELSQVGYGKNDAFTGYIGMGSPKQLTREQVATLKGMATGKPAQQRTVQVGRDGKFSLGLPLRENDVYLIKLTAVK
jgi:xylan 1,4-beta-xylosidase